MENLAVIFVLIGMLGFLAEIILLIVHAIKKQELKKDLVGLGLFLVLTIIGFIIMPSSDNNEIADNVIEEPTVDNNIIEEVIEDIDVFINVSGSQLDEKTVFYVDTNLPDDAELMLTLSNGKRGEDGSYSASTKIKITDGKGNNESEGLTKSGERIEGEYDLVVSMSIPSVQSDIVREVIGQKGERLVGSLVDENSKAVKAYFKVDIGETVEVSPENDYQFTSFSTEEEIEEKMNSQDEEAENVDKEEMAELFISYAKGILGNAFGENNYSISREGTAVVVNVWYDNVAMGATLAAAGDKSSIEGWKAAKEGLQATAEAMYNSFVETTGFEDANVMVNLINDQNKDNVLLTFLNGICIYDCVDAQ